jgi:hypothetical protein
MSSPDALHLRFAAAGQLRRPADTVAARPQDPNHFFIMLWATTQFYADFAEVAAVTLEKGRLSVTDYEAAQKTIVKVILSGCLPAS